jgi:hypothetical protein
MNFSKLDLSDPLAVAQDVNIFEDKRARDSFKFRRKFDPFYAAVASSESQMSCVFRPMEVVAADGQQRFPSIMQH